MNADIRQAVTAWMNSVGVRNPEELGIEDWQQVKRLLGNDRPGFGVFLSLMQFERQKAVQQLINLDLGDPADVAAAAKLQGVVYCVDMVRDLILNIADPSGEGSDSTQEIAGVKFYGERAEQQPVGTSGR